MSFAFLGAAVSGCASPVVVDGTGVWVGLFVLEHSTPAPGVEARKAKGLGVAVGGSLRAGWIDSRRIEVDLDAPATRLRTEGLEFATREEADRWATEAGAPAGVWER
jgi:hypothetical protein